MWIRYEIIKTREAMYYGKMTDSLGQERTTGKNKNLVGACAQRQNLVKTALKAHTNVTIELVNCKSYG